MAKQTIDERIEKLKDQLNAALREGGYLEIGTRVKLLGTVVGVDTQDKEFTYQVAIDGDMPDDNDALAQWYTPQSVKESN